ncbi:MAG: Holliday junction branch migration protein RuvA [SAR324 cluster bacterium]|nr:Holliday junction branch migration protein RuvA [SAR324 cluster bacterium]
MIAYLEGTVFLTEADYLVIKTATGVGYQVFLPKPLLLQAVVNESVHYHIQTYVRDGEGTLYGFASLEEKKLFEMLIKTSGVGPKLGIMILSILRPPQLIQAIHQQNIPQLNSIPGIGKKTASKLFLDMTDQLKKHPIAGQEWEKDPKIPNQSSASETDELLSALTNMGFSEKDVLSILGQIHADGQSFEEQIKKALALLTSFN